MEIMCHRGTSFNENLLSTGTAGVGLFTTTTANYLGGAGLAPSSGTAVTLVSVTVL